MKKSIFKPFALLLAVVAILTAASCQQASANNELKVIEFKQKLESTTDKVLLDVRTPEEYAEGHLAGSLNIDWNGDAFDAGVAKLDKSKPVFVYCRSGRRSAAAASAMRQMGFKQVYEMKGGIEEWKENGLPEEKGAAAPLPPAATGMTQADFDALLNTDKLVLVDFYATWCGPCKRMEPFLSEISKDMEATVSVVRIDADANPTLATSMKVDALPTVFIYKNKQLVWNNVGFVSREDMIAKLKSIK